MKTTDFRTGGFFDGMSFSVEHDDIRGKWFKMTDEVKRTYVDELMNMINEHFSRRNASCDRFKTTVEDMDKHCEEWQNIYAENKQKFVGYRNRHSEEYFSRGGISVRWDLDSDF